jgi:hypothetical protein
MRTQKTEAEKKIKPLLDPNQSREDATETGGEYAGRYPRDSGPDIVRPGVGGEAEGQTTHE